MLATSHGTVSKLAQQNNPLDVSHIAHNNYTISLEVDGSINNQGGKLFTNTNFTLQPEDDFPPDPIPPMPSLLLGRDKLLHNIVEHLRNNRHVALHGPGGIGKSSIAKAVLYDSTIVKEFRSQLFFVRFDDIDPSQLTFHMFFKRIAKALGVKASEKHPDNSVRKHLSSASNKMLLVLDNAETFLQADDRQLKSAVDELAEMETVTIMLTTRTSQHSIPRLETIDVPRLDEGAAYATFAKTYGTDACPPGVKNLISTLECHPLSIILLAQVAKQNKWSPERLVTAWKEHETRLLRIGKHNLEITIELSLKSPSVMALPDAHDFLRAIAFLPQGVDEEKLKDQFCEVKEVDLLATALCGQSLLYIDGGRITMLAPIRLYLTKRGGSEPSLLVGVRTYYYSQLEKFADGKEEKEGGAWISTEDINVERLIALDLGRHENMQTSCQACDRFTKLLVRHKLRPTALSPVVRALPQREPKLLESFRLRFLPAFRRVHPLVSKGTCLQSLASLADNLSQTKEALDLYREAEMLFILAMDRDMVIGCMREIGDIYVYLGDFVAAGELFKKAQSECKLPDTRAALNLSLGNVAMFTNQPDGRKLLIEAERYYRDADDADDMNNAIELRGSTEIFSGDYQAARRCFEQVKEDTYTLIALSEVSSREGNPTKALELLDTAVTKAKDEQESNYARAFRAAVFSDQGDFTRSREQIEEVIKKTSLSDGDISMNLAWYVYISARNELFAGRLPESRELFFQANAMFEELGDIRFRARCERALGEIAFLWKESLEADERFTKVQSLCQDMRISAELLYTCFSSFFLKDSFEGWKRYQERHITVPVQVGVSSVSSRQVGVLMPFLVVSLFGSFYVVGILLQLF